MRKSEKYKNSLMAVVDELKSEIIKMFVSVKKKSVDR
jgi:hypothetical protein